MSVNRFYILSGLTGLLAAVSVAQATDIEVAGLFNGKAMVSINGSPAKVMAAGQTLQNVKLISASSSAAIFEVDGKKQTLGMGQSISTAAGNSGSKPTVKLTADGGGHFNTGGSINGRPINFLVDTGATTVAISVRSAQAMGIDLRKAGLGASNTAAGVVRTYRVTFDNVKIGDISLNFVEGNVLEGMPDDFALLGNSFLSRLDMKREGTVLTLTKNY
ncbi:MAG: TIGR02281 family clan AA aspartic protease [Burkholderiales bacterium]|nr:TIGR02281 family clan AA aspartic protease [Burkholderiales bacterium]